MKKYIFIMAILLVLPGVIAETYEVGNTLWVNYTGNNLTIRTDNRVWSFNTGSNFYASLDNSFKENITCYGNCSGLKHYFDEFNKSFEKCDNVWKANNENSEALAGCESGKNSKCSEQKSLYENASSSLSTCKTDLSSCNNDKSNCNTKLNEWTTMEEGNYVLNPKKKEDYYKRDDINMAILIVGIILFYWFVIRKKYGKITGHKELDIKKSGGDFTGVDFKQLDEDMKNGR